MLKKYKYNLKNKIKISLKTVVVLFLILIFSINTVYAKTSYKKTKRVTRQVVKPSKGVIAAKTEAFKNVKYNLSYISYKTYLTDKNYDVNMNYIENQTYKSSDNARELSPYFLGETLISYGVKYAEKPNYQYFYNSNGNLIRIEMFNQKQTKYPQKILTYNNKGKLHTVVLYISKTEQYNFDGDGNLIVHWIGERGFNKYGKPIKIKRTI